MLTELLVKMYDVELLKLYLYKIGKRLKICSLRIRMKSELALKCCYYRVLQKGTIQDSFNRNSLLLILL